MTDDIIAAEVTGTMNAAAFRKWRKLQGWKQAEAAARLGLKKRMIQYYEKGDRSGKAVAIPKTVRLACAALSRGIGDFDGMSEIWDATAIPAPVHSDM